MQEEEIGTQICIYSIGKRLFVVKRIGLPRIMQAHELCPTISALCDSFAENKWKIEKRKTGCIWKTVQIM